MFNDRSSGIWILLILDVLTAVPALAVCPDFAEHKAVKVPDAPSE